MFAPGWIIVQVEDYVRVPSAHQHVDGGRFDASQQLMVPVRINPVRVAARSHGTTVRIRFGNYGQLDGRNPGGQLTRRPIEQRLDRPARAPFVAVLPGQNQDFQRRVGVPAPHTDDRSVFS
jgi:hypothetical protein